MLEVYRETVDPLHSQLFKERLALDADGYAVAPDRPGFGVEPNDDLLQPYRVV